MTNITRKITPAQEKALEWFDRKGGTGVFTKDGSAVIAGGDQGSFTRATWIALRDALRVTINGTRLTSLTNGAMGAPIARNPSEPFAHGMINALPGAE